MGNIVLPPRSLQITITLHYRQYAGAKIDIVQIQALEMQADRP